MWHRSDIRNGSNPQSQRLDCPDGIFTSRTGPFDEQFHFLYAHRLGSLNRLFSCQAGGKRRAFARAFETSRACATPADRIPLRVGYGDDGIVE